ncbi:MAG: hypothetical protein MOGMAGMI_00625 [Candidatus Omnitrophica bacterium]|nr:hypothetical protein [Candidatus Omnitrophota bacterium]
MGLSGGAQEALVAVLAALAAGYLVVRRLRRRKSCCGADGKCPALRGSSGQAPVKRADK